MVYKRNIITYFRSKRLNVFMLFVILALLFSVLTKLSRSYTQTFSFKIQAINVPEDNVIINDANQVINITLTNYGFKHIKYYFGEPTIEIDFSGLQKTKTHFNWVESNDLPFIRKQFDVSTRVENVTPDTLQFLYDVNSVKMVPVVLDSEVKFSSGYDIIDTFHIEPDSIKIIGPKVITDSIFEIRTKKMVVENINSDIRNSVKLNLPTKTSDVNYSSNEVIVTASVERFTEGTINVPINVVNVPDNVKINYYPKVVPVVYYTSLSNFKAISSSSFLVECDYNAVNKENTYLIPKIVQRPESVKSTRLNTKKIEFILTQ